MLFAITIAESDVAACHMPCLMLLSCFADAGLCLFAALLCYADFLPPHDAMLAPACCRRHAMLMLHYAYSAAFVDGCYAMHAFAGRHFTLRDYHTAKYRLAMPPARLSPR